MKLFLVGIKQDDGEIKHIKCFINPTWAIKYGKSAGESAVFAETNMEFTSTPPLAKVK